MGQDDTDPTGKQVLEDTADRLERTIDKQLERIADIDEKAAHTTRLVGILLALVFTLLTLVLSEGPGTIGTVSGPVKVAFIGGLGALLGSLGLAIVTYLSSRCRTGLHQDVAIYLKQGDVSVPRDDHLRFVIGSYGTMIAENNRVLLINGHRFRTALGSLLAGILFLSAAGMLYFAGLVGTPAWLVIGATAVVALSINLYFAKEKFMTQSAHSDDNG